MSVEESGILEPHYSIMGSSSLAPCSDRQVQVLYCNDCPQCLMFYFLASSTEYMVERVLS